MRPFFQMRLKQRTCLFLAAVVLLLHANGARSVDAQTAVTETPVQTAFDATHLWEPTDVGGTWLIHAGDDPAYAAPGFDDSQWTPFDISKPLQPLFPGGNPGVVWYRRRIKVAPDQVGLAVRESNVSGAFVVYGNGVELAHAGQVAPYVAYDTSAPLIARIPNAEMAKGLVVLTVRVHNDDAEWKGDFPGLFPGNIRLGREQELYQQRWFSVMQHQGAQCVAGFLSLIFSVVGFVLFSSERARKEYLWFSLFGISVLLNYAPYLYGAFHVYPAWWVRLRIIPEFGQFWFLYPMSFAFMRQRIRPALATVILVCCLGGSLLAQPDLGPTASLFLAVPIEILGIIVIPGLLIIHWRRGNREAALLLVPALLLNASFFEQIVHLIVQALGHPYRQSWSETPIARVGSFYISPIDLTEILFWVIIGLIILLRSNRMSREAEVHQGQVAAAREVQQILVPALIEATPGFVIDTSYLPAQEVGGDFFQVIPVHDGGVLVVVGDVAGKGLPAAMMVSVLVGAIRTLAAFTQYPAEVLAQLNERLVGRSGGGFSTAVAAHIASDGSMRIANAGHLSPYFDGEELALPGALPLGIVSGTTYETVDFQLDRGSRLTFYSDGVIEAQNSKGELLGFERGRELSTQPADAIVAAAKKFGQSDDITVVAVSRQ